MKLVIPIKIWIQMMNYAEICLPNEVTGNGIIELNRGLDTFRVREIFLPTQSVEPAFSQFGETGLHEIITDLIEEGRKDDVEKLKFRWHSHGMGAVFFSGVDVMDIRSETSDYVVNLVINGRGERLARLDMKRPFRIENIPLEVVFDYFDSRLTKKCRDEMAKKVTIIKRDALKKGEVFHGEDLFGKGFFGPDQVV